MCLDVMLLLIYIQGVPSDHSAVKQCITKPSGPDSILNKQGRKRFIMKADGNCMFCSLSFLFFGSENAHSKLRSLLVKVILLNNSCSAL